jgi:hypothetical protein
MKGLERWHWYGLWVVLLLMALVALGGCGGPDPFP